MLSVGMVLFLASELMFFSALFAMYFTLRAGATPWPPAGIELEVLPPVLFTSLLVLSSATMQMAVRRIRAGRLDGLRRWTWLTILLAVAFLGGQLRDWLTADFEISTNAYGSAFFTMTGFHGLHVIGGILLMLVVLGRAGAGAYSAREHTGVEVVSYYWHFVDVVWIAMFSTIFLLQ
jgi:cytochrome c oxidase subunit III